MEAFVNDMETLLRSAPWLADKRVVLVVNMAAGGFANRALHMLRTSELKRFMTTHAMGSIDNPCEITRVMVNVDDATAPAITLPPIFQIEKTKSMVVIVLGGDGIAGGVTGILSCQHDSICKRSTLFMAPMGTGNDGAGAPDMYRAAEVLWRGPDDGVLEPAKVIKVNFASAREPVFAFNIVSLGLDAFVSHAANIIKAKLPGNFYKLMVDAAALFYDLFYRVRSSRVVAELEDGGELFLEKKLLLFCMGYAGGATYGGGKCVIPGPENVAALEYLSIPKRIAYKNRVSDGRGRGIKEMRLFSSQSVAYYYDGPILLQTDGECLHLGKEDFPVHINVISTPLRVLKEGQIASNSL